MSPAVLVTLLFLKFTYGEYSLFIFVCFGGTILVDLDNGSTDLTALSFLYACDDVCVVALKYLVVCQIINWLTLKLLKTWAMQVQMSALLSLFLELSK